MPTPRGVSDPVSVLRGSRIFGALPKRELKTVARYSRPVIVEAGVELVAEGQSGAEFCIVVTGECTVHRDGEVKRTLGPGDCFGEIAVIDGRARTATVTATEMTELLVLGQSDFEHALKVAPGLGRAVMNQLCSNLRSLEGDDLD